MYNTPFIGATNASDALLLRRNYAPFLTSEKYDKKNAQKLNIIQLNMELDFISNLFISRFKWNSEDFGITNFYIERCLFYYGLIAFYDDPKKGWIVLPARPLSFNIYGEPLSVNLIGFNYNRIVDIDHEKKNIFLIRDNPYCYTPYLIFRWYAGQIADLARTVEVYQNNMKKPRDYVGNFDKKESFKQAFYQQANNEYFRFLDTSLINKDLGELTVIENTTHNSQDLRGLQMHKYSIYSEMLSKMGISNQQIEKMAQVSNEEINKNDVMTRLVLESSYECRIQEVEKIKEVADKELQCDIFVDSSTIPEEEIENPPENGGENASVK